MKQKLNIFWFRRDLRLEDNTGLYKALCGSYPIMPIFIFDTHILEHLPKNDARVTFIFETLESINNELKNKYQSSLAVYFGKPIDVYKQLQQSYDIQEIHTNEDFEPYAIKRDNEVQSFSEQHNISFHTYKDQVIFAKNEIVKADGNPYVVYTPYKNKWKEKFDSSLLEQTNIDEKTNNFIKKDDLPFVTLEEIGFTTASIKVPPYKTTPDLIQNYGETRDFPGIKQGTSRLGPHLRFGTVSIRQIVTKAIAEENDVFWSELIWREFFMQILWHFPHTINKAFKPKYDRIVWRNNEDEFEKWKSGKTGYPLVDAGMRELNTTGYMHNRVRMLVASFLCKHLLIDWRWGERYFAEKLVDYELSANVGNWQWASGSGVDAAPYFRIFNPTTQVTKFDKQLTYIRKWVPELNELSYSSPVVDHKFARERCLKVYKEALN